MKRLLILIFAVFALTSCFKDYNEDFLLTEKYVEFEDAVVTSNASGKNYAILPNIFSLNGVVSYRVNMFGEQSANDQSIAFQVVLDESTAVEGRDFRFVNGANLIVPKFSSFGYLMIEVLPSIEGNKVLVVDLIGNSEVKPSPNYKRIGIGMSNAVKLPDPAVINEYTDYIHVNDITLGGDANTNLGCFIDMQTANIYTWEGSALFSDKATVGYFHSGSNYSNFVFPGLSTMLSSWSVYYNRILNWSTKPNGILVRYTNISATDEVLFDNISSSADVENAVLAAQANVGTRHGSSSTYGPGERIRSLQPGDHVFMYSSTGDFYAVIRVKEALTDNTVESIGRTIRFEYKVQK